MAKETKEKRLDVTIRRITVFFLFALVFALTCHVLTDFDIWWHLRTGKYIVENQHIPKADIFSYIAAGRPWVDLRWLFQVVPFSIYYILGASGLKKQERT